jgi:Tfp pilus assembly protein PilO
MRKVEIIKIRWRLFVVPLVTIFFIVVSVFLVLIPRIKMILQLNLAVGEGEKRLSRLTTKAADLEGLDAVSLKERKDFSLKVVPQTKNVMDFMTLFSNLAQSSQVYLSSLEVSPGDISTQSGTTTSQEGFEVLPFEVIVEGTRERILDFISLVEKSIPLMSVRSFKIAESGESVRAQLRVESYVAPLPKNLGKIDSPLVKLSQEDEKIFKLLENFKTYEVGWTSAPASFSARTDPFSF